MGILTRIIRLCKADLHGVMDHLEDKELLLKQYLREMEAGLQEKENQLNQMARQEELIRRDLALRSEEIEKLENDLILSLHKDKDDIAKLLIRKQKNQKAMCHQLRRHLDTLEEQRQLLGRVLEKQRLQCEHIKIKAASYNSREEPYAADTAHTVIGDTGAGMVINDKEIELELLRRKEALLAGGGA